MQSPPFDPHENNGQLNGSSNKRQLTPILQHILQRGQTAFEVLCEAAVYARDVNRSIWDFSLEIKLLRECGLAQSDLRWLVCKGFLQHGKEMASGDSMTRQFNTMPTLSFGRDSCFVITEEGEAIVCSALNGEIDGDDSVNAPASRNRQSSGRPQIKPTWDRDRQEIRVGRQVVKQFKVPAPNQEVILAAFQEENWPDRIDDPLPRHPDLDPKRRLQDTIQSLNRNQKSCLLRFFSDGTGERVGWEFVDTSESSQRP